MAGFLNKYKNIAVVLLIFLFHGMNNFAWLKLNSLPPYDDLAIHLSGALELIAISHGLADIFVRSTTFIVQAFYPPLFHLFMAVFNLLFGLSETSAVMANTPFLLILLTSLYYTGKKAFSAAAGVLSGFIVMMYPGVFALARLSLPDFAMTAMLSLSFCLLLYSEYFSLTLPSLLFGVSCGLGMLTKQILPLFLLAPLLYVIGDLILTGRILEKRTAANLTASFLITCAVAGYWYVSKFSIIWPSYVKVEHGGYVYRGIQSCPDILSSASISYYANNLVKNQMLMFYFIIFAAALVKWLASGGSWKLKSQLMFSIAAPYAAFTLIFTKHTKSTSPFLIFFGLISAAGIMSIKNTGLRRGIIALVVVFGLFQYYDLSFKNGMFFSYLRKLPVTGILVPKFNMETPFRTAFQPVRCPPVSREIFSLIKKESGDNKMPVVAGSDTSVNDYGAMSGVIANSQSLVYEMKVNGLPWELVHYEHKDIGDREDFAVMVYKIDPGAFRLIKTYVLPDSSSVYVYKHIPT